MKYEKGSFVVIPNKDELFGLEPHVQAIFFWICNYADENGICFPSRTTLANCAGCSVKSVDRAFEILVEKKMLLKQTRKNGEKNLTNIYQILIVDTDLEGGGVPQSLGRDSQSLGVASHSRTELYPVLTQPTDTAFAGSTEEIKDVPLNFEENSGDSKSPKISGDQRKAWDEMIRWSENERGFPFPKTSKLKQYRAFKIAKENGFTRETLQERWEEMSGDKFWQGAGFDWMNVITSLLKKPI